jgi:hypothetical protein
VAAGYSQAPLNYQPQLQQPAGYQQAAGYQQGAGSAQPQSWSAEQADPHHKHQDARHNHNHVYPDRGTVVSNLPAGSNVVNFGGQSYWFADGVWFEPRGAAYMVIEPPIGVIVSALPAFATAVVGSAGLYFYANDTYYRPRPDLGGYEVVNDPVDSSPAGSAAAPLAAPGVAPAMMAAPAVAAMTASAAPGALAAPAPSAMAAPQGAAFAATPAAAQLPPRTQMVTLIPNNGQTPEQQARDRYDCYRLGLSQSGYDPLHPKAGVSPDQESAYDRVRTGCLQQRGYTVQ